MVKISRPVSVSPSPEAVRQISSHFPPGDSGRKQLVVLPRCLLAHVWVYLLISTPLWLPEHLILPGMKSRIHYHSLKWIESLPIPLAQQPALHFHEVIIKACIGLLVKSAKFEMSYQSS